MRIVDVHAPLGADQVFEHDFARDARLAAQSANGVNTTLVQPGSVHLAAARAQHDAIAGLAAEYPGHPTRRADDAG